MHDPRLALLRRALEARRVLRIERSPTHREAAVALLLRPRESLEILLIRRAVRAADPWSGHMALPGGRRSESDLDLLATALRETEEEIGVAALSVGELIGPLDDVAPASPRLPPIVISPYVIAVPAESIAIPDPRDVDAAVWVPIPALRAQGAVSEILIQLQEGERAFPSLRFGEYVIWGLTHRILVQFLEVAEEAGV
jgi:8-oxo-dGTP pyrophosphatase MutT (NUDIX family)